MFQNHECLLCVHRAAWMHGTKYPGGQRWVKVNTAGTLRYSVTSVLHAEVKEYGFYVLILGENLLCV
jgi:hypothetical protein